MTKHFEDFDYNRIRRLRKAAVSIGRAHLRMSKSTDNSLNRELALFAAATTLRRAAAHSLLIGQIDMARSHFSEAATVYLQAESTYGVFLSNLGQGETDDYPLEGPRFASDVFWLWNSRYLRARHLTEADPLRTFRKRLDGYRTEGVGILHIPVAVYLDLFDSLVDASEDAVAAALLPIVAVYSAAIRRAREDRYHWTRLATPFHPVEPDIVGILLAAGQVLQARGKSLVRIMNGLPITRDALILLQNSLDLYGIWNEP